MPGTEDPVPTTTDFLQQIDIVRRARAISESKKARIKEVREAFEKSIAESVAESREYTVKTVEAESILREMAVKAFEADPTNKKPAPGVGIRVVSELIYDKDVALEFAKANLPAMTETTLNTKEFETWADRRIAEGNTLPIPVSKFQTATATIAKDL